MGFMSDIEIAQSVTPKHILEIAKSAGVDEKYVEQYGNDKAKIDLALLNETDKKNGKLILVTAITPTPAGEGKTTTTIGLADGLKRIGKRVAVALREPSLGPVFGVKGGAAGGGDADHLHTCWTAKGQRRCDVSVPGLSQCAEKNGGLLPHPL